MDHGQRVAFDDALKRLTDAIGDLNRVVTESREQRLSARPPLVLRDEDVTAVREPAARDYHLEAEAIRLIGGFRDHGEA